jgi:small subunit ribosomal protein S5
MEEKLGFRVIDLRRVAKVTAGGKRMKVRAAVVVGDMKNKVGLGIAKGLDIPDAVLKARKQAEKNFMEVPIVDGTVPFEVKAKFAASRILIKPAKKGRGVIAGSVVRTILTLAGYTDVSAKILGATKNPLVNALAVFKALEKLYKSYNKKLKLKDLKPSEQNANSSSKV